jgi:purine-binding chemotaxis protein CheW
MTDAWAASTALTDSGTAPSVQLLVFELETLRIALPVATVQEVVRAVAISPLPQAPPVIEGVINLRGVLVPAFDLRRRFGLPPRPLSPQHHLIFAYAGPRLAALRVDRAVDLIAVAPSDIQSAEEIVPAAGYGAAIARLPDGLIVVHDLERFLSPLEADQVDAALISALQPRPAVADRSGDP